ncbi:FecR domain-containing protein [Antarcticibacterium sp. 1MA-6-2]|uniref:FecR domain-containing protein n=1 Tax=Antarcticibacterium sp. 1MA-6-2 TaxID=2908210 RepID=UPI001F3A8F03|nr:FecR domain-containing protein [Antarcticibacterium sp. 1MA-6-2]UJH92695.1 FecR domain-containing protein [Antarcticibacterium sp. 1MA-6-2]
MTDKNYISELINKLMNNQLTEDEYNALIAIIDNAENQEKIQGVLGEYLEGKKDHGNFSFNRNDEDAEKLFSRIMQKVEKEEAVLNLKTKREKVWLGKTIINEFYKIAAVLILVVGIFYFFKDDIFYSREASIAAPTNAEAGDITLKLADGEVVVISQNDQKEILGEKGSLVAEQNGSRLSYTNKNKNSEFFYNELSIPYGKKFDLVLADGTQVTLNAGSWIKYPVQFSEDGNRKVFFKGEAYFDVAEDKVRSFVVNTECN